MANEQYKEQKRPLKFTKGEIDRAARDIRHGADGENRIDAITKIQNFREFHLYPLMLMKNHLARTSAKVGKKIIVARRLKRLPTIIDKLERPTLDGKQENSIKLTRMQDIAGCRAIVKNLEQLELLQHRLENSRSVHKIINIRDYLRPKSSGYGGVHLIYSCYEGQNEPHNWKKAKVEVQLRTELQHAWATSLEIIDTLEQIELKTRHDGHDNWRRFFAISGKLVAHDEGACLLPELELVELKNELLDLVNELDVISMLARYTIAISFTTDKRIAKKVKNGQGMFLVCMHYPETTESTKNVNRLNATVEYFSSKNSEQAIKELNAAELNEKIALTVLVSAPDVRALKQAYPNYFGSTRQFTDFIDRQIENRAE